MLAIVIAGSAGLARAQELRPIARGRSLTWGASAIVPMYLGDVRERDGRAIAYLAPGGGIDGRVGYELPGGLALGVTGGIAAHASENSRALVSYRGAVEARWVIDVGADVAPLVGLAAGVFLAQLDAGLVATAYARVLAGMQILLAPWAALEIAISIEGALPFEAFADAIAWVSPQFGVSFYE